MPGVPTQLWTNAPNLDVLPDGAILEWHVSDPVGAAAIRDVLKQADIEGITVIYTPKP